MKPFSTLLSHPSYTCSSAILLLATTSILALSLSRLLSHPTTPAHSPTPAPATSTTHSTPPPPPHTLPCAGPCGSRYLSRVAPISAHAASNIRHALCSSPPPTRTSLRPVVLDAAPGSTGTRSLAMALALLGHRTLHNTIAVLPPPHPRARARSIPVNHQGVFVGKVAVGALGALFRARTSSRAEQCHEVADGFDYVEAFEGGFDALVDAPVAEFWYAAFLAFPRSKVVFSRREPAEWAARRLAHSGASLPYLRPCAHSRRAAWEEVGGEERVAELLRATEEFVQCVVPRERLLTIDVFEGAADPRATWEKLAAFLGRNATELKSKCTFPHNFTVRCDGRVSVANETMATST